MKIFKVDSLSDEKSFFKVPDLIYKDDANWIKPLRQEVEAVFDRKKNKYFKEGVLERWVLKDNSGTLIGRIAAFEHHKLSKGYEQPTGGIGFFECIHDQAAANLLFDTARFWLRERGMEAMDGPINFGEKDKWWGLLVYAETQVMFNQSYNPPYYKELFETYGFRNYYEQYNYLYDIVNHAVPEKFTIKARELEKDPDYLFTHVQSNAYVKYAEDFRTVYNNAWAKGHFNFKPMTTEQAIAIMRSLKPIADNRLMYFGYHRERPIAMWIMIPDLNQIVKYLKGNLNWLGKIRFVYYHKVLKKCRKAMGIVFGVDPEYQGIGVEGAIIKASEKVLRGPYKRYDTMEMTWIAEFNPKMIHVVEGLGVRKTKIRITYRYLFDRDREFTRHPIVGSRT